MRNKGEVNCSFVALAAVLLLAAVGSPPAAAVTKGMVIDHTTFRAVVFDADSDTVLGSVAIPKGTFIDIVFDCSITADQKLGFVAQLDIFGTSGVYVIDLDTISLASGTNPILVSSLPEYLSITPDGKYVVVGNSGSARGWPVSVIDMGADPYLQ